MTLFDIKILGRKRSKVLGKFYNKFVIYKIQNIFNQKIYIGLTKDLSNRLTQHFRNVKNNTKKYIISSAISKYGLENFSFEIIDQCESEYEMNQKEIYWIKHYNSNTSENGYNLTSGGNNFSLNEDQKIKKRAEAKNKKPIYIYDKLGKFLREYKSVRDCARALGTTAVILFKAVKAGFLVKNSFIVKYEKSENIEPHKYNYSNHLKNKVPPKTFKWRLTDLKNNKIYEEVGIRKLAEISGYKEDIIRSIAYNRNYYNEYKKYLTIEKLKIYNE